MRIIIIAIVILFNLNSCTEQIAEEMILFDFESDAELDRMHWKCFTMFSLSDEHVTHGTKSLRMELYPSSWPGLAPKLGENDWRGFEVFGLDVYNPEPEQIMVTLRIDDRKDYPDYDDRYNQKFFLKPGMNQLEIPFSSMVTSGTKRHLDLKRIYRILIFMGHPKKKHVLYVDYIRLVSG